MDLTTFYMWSLKQHELTPFGSNFLSWNPRHFGGNPPSSHLYRSIPVILITL